MKLQIIGLVIWFLLFSYGCQRKEVKKEETAQAIPVKVMRVRLEDITETIEYVGDIKAEDEVLVYPKVSGKIIEKVREDGASVNKGEAIAYIDRDEVGFKFEKAPVESPLTGIVGRLYVDLGQNVNAQTPVALVVNMDRVKINLEIPERYLPRVSLGQIARIGVDAYPQEEFNGRITKISPVAEPATRTVPVEITLDNPRHRLISGMFARVSLVIEKHANAPVILKESVIGKGADTYVYVIENERAVLKKVSLGIRQGPYYAVKDGLKAEEAVVIMGQQRLRDNAPVVVEIEENKKP